MNRRPIDAARLGDRFTADARAQNRARGFTILEIMIATAILTLGLVGILALFPVAIHSGKQVVERSTAVVIAESVAEAIRDGMRNHLRYSRDGDAYFLFNHDGVESEIPALADREKPSADYYILLPKYRGGRRGFSGRRRQEKALAAARTFCYPETDRPANGRGRERRADDDGNDQQHRFSNGQTFEDVKIQKVYKMGTLLPGLKEKGPYILDDQKIDSLKQYSYAFSITPSMKDANLSPLNSTFVPAGRLFHVRVMVFRGFAAPEAHDRDAVPPDPVFELDFEVSL